MAAILPEEARLPNRSVNESAVVCRAFRLKVTWFETPVVIVPSWARPTAVIEAEPLSVFDIFSTSLSTPEGTGNERFDTITGGGGGAAADVGINDGRYRGIAVE